MQQTLLPYSKSKKQGPRLLTAWRSPRAMSLCHMLPGFQHLTQGHCLAVNHNNVAWHSVEVVFEDVKGFVKKYFPPNFFNGFCWFSVSLLSPTQIVSNPVSFVLWVGVRGMHEEQVVAYSVAAISALGLSHRKRE